MEPGVEQSKAGGQHARICLDAAYEDTLGSKARQVMDYVGRRQIAVLDEYVVGGHEAVIIHGRAPAELAFKRHPHLVVALDGGHGRHGGAERGDLLDEPGGRREARLKVNDQKDFVHTG